MHLTAAAALFAGGTISESLRGECNGRDFAATHFAKLSALKTLDRVASAVYFLWCQSRAQAIRVRGDSDDTRRHSCRRFVHHPLLPDEGTAGAAAAGLLEKPEALGAIRPWLTFCMLVGLVGAGLSLSQENEMQKYRLRAPRGDVLLSPVATAFCPQPDFKYLHVSTVKECHRATARLRTRWNVTMYTGGGQAEEKARQDGLSGNLAFERVLLRTPFEGVLTNLSAEEACVVASNAIVAQIPKLSLTQPTEPGERLVPPSFVPPNTVCNLMNFNETHRSCMTHDDGQPMEFLVRCSARGDGQCDGYSTGSVCLPGGDMAAANRSVQCCAGMNKSFAATCCPDTCSEPSPYVYQVCIPLGRWFKHTDWAARMTALPCLLLVRWMRRARRSGSPSLSARRQS